MSGQQFKQWQSWLQSAFWLLYSFSFTLALFAFRDIYNYALFPSAHYMFLLIAGLSFAVGALAYRLAARLPIIQDADLQPFGFFLISTSLAACFPILHAAQTQLTPVLFAVSLLPFFLFGLMAPSRGRGQTSPFYRSATQSLLGVALASVIYAMTFSNEGPFLALLLSASAMFVAQTAAVPFSNWPGRVALCVTPLIIGVLLGIGFVSDLPRAPHPYRDRQRQTYEPMFRQWHSPLRLEALRPKNKPELASQPFLFLMDSDGQGFSVSPHYSPLVDLGKKYSSDSEGHLSTMTIGLSHFLRKDEPSDVLIIGPASFEGIQASLMFQSSSITAAEPWFSEIEPFLSHHKSLTDGIWNHPDVETLEVTGRSFLKQNPEKQYDIIQVMSPYLSPVPALGLSDLRPDEQWTVEALKLYIKHLKPEGILHFVMPGPERLATTLAVAWHEMGRTDLQPHVMVLRRKVVFDHLKSILIKNKPWSKNEVDQVQTAIEGKNHLIAYNPLQPLAGWNVQYWHLTYPLPTRLKNRNVYDIAPVFDDKPFLRAFDRPHTQRPVFGPPPRDSMNQWLQGIAHKYGIPTYHFWPHTLFIPLMLGFGLFYLLFFTLQFVWKERLEATRRCLSSVSTLFLAGATTTTGLIFTFFLEQLQGQSSIEAASLAIFLLTVSALSGLRWSRPHGPALYWTFSALLASALFALFHENIVSALRSYPLTVQQIFAAGFFLPIGWTIGTLLVGWNSFLQRTSGFRGQELWMTLGLSLPLAAATSFELVLAFGYRFSLLFSLSILVLLVFVAQLYGSQRTELSQ